MNTTPAQLRLAADILETGHPFEVRHDASDRWHASLGVNPAQAVLQDWHLRPVLATPPDNRPLHNPDNLTAEQVGVGYRLALPGESAASPHDFWDGNTWKKAKLLGPAIFAWCCRSCRLPISAPWPEPEKTDPYAELKAAHAAGKAIQWFNGTTWIDLIKPVDPSPLWLHPAKDLRIKPTESAKPEEPAFQLPPCALGMRWHREDGWKPEDLPPGYRPHIYGEGHAEDEWRLADGWQRLPSASMFSSAPGNLHRRTTRPLTFNHAGKTWTWHRPGDPMPCDGEARIEIVCHEGRTEQEDGIKYFPRLARNNIWRKTLGWRYAEPQTKTVPLGPEDVPPGSVFRSKDQPTTTFWTVAQVWEDGFYLRGDSMPWDTARERMQINRSLSKGQWNPDAWEPCSKTIPA